MIHPVERAGAPARRLAFGQIRTPRGAIMGAARAQARFAPAVPSFEQPEPSAARSPEVIL